MHSDQHQTHNTRETHYSKEELAAIRDAIIDWNRVQHLPARDFWHLDLNTLGYVQLVAAADRFLYMDEVERAVEALRLAQALSTRNPAVSHTAILDTIAEYHYQKREYGAGLDVLRHCIESSIPSEKQNQVQEPQCKTTTTNAHPEAEEPEASLANIKQAIADDPSDPWQYLTIIRLLIQLGRRDEAVEYLDQAQVLAQELKDNESSTKQSELPVNTDPPLLLGRFVQIEPDLAAQLEAEAAAITGPLQRTENFDWYDYIEQIRSCVFQALFLASHENGKGVHGGILASLVQRLTFEGMTWTALTRPEDVVPTELTEFAHAIRALRLRSIDTVAPNSRMEYHEFMSSFSITQQEAEACHLAIERYFKGQYDQDNTPLERISQASQVASYAKQMALPLVAEAGALLLTSELITEARFLEYERALTPEIQEWAGGVMGMTLMLSKQGLLPMQPVEQERVLWQKALNNVPVDSIFGIPDFHAMSMVIGRKATKSGTDTANLATQSPGGDVGTAKVGRNDPCPCGSGKKFKKCCGR